MKRIDFSPLTAPLTRWAKRRAEANNVTLSPDFRRQFDTLLAFWSRAESEGSVCVNLKRSVLPLVGFDPAHTDDTPMEVNANAPEAVSLAAPSAYVFKDYSEVDALLNDLEAVGLLTRQAPQDPLISSVVFVLDETPTDAFLYVFRHWAEEGALADNVLQGVRAPATFPTFTQTELDTVLAKTPSFTLNAGQQAGILTAMHHPFSVISGGPGTGKTTSIVYLLASYLSQTPDPLSVRVGLAAPTGKATARMKESIANSLKAAKGALGEVEKLLESGGFTAQTLHKWLVSPTALGERPSKTNPLTVDLFVVDEASMVDAQLADRVFEVIDFKRTTVILLGDKNQLAAVGPGSVFADLSDTTASAPLKGVVTLLTESRRFKDDSWVGKLARAVNDGNVLDTQSLFADAKEATFGEDAPVFAPTLGKDQALPIFVPLRDADRESVTFREFGFSEAAKAWMDTFLEAYEGALTNLNTALQAKDRPAIATAERALFGVLNTYRALGAQRRGALGVDALNRYAEDRIKAFVTDTLNWSVTDDLWPGRVVMVRQNDDELGVFNGDAAVLVPSVTGNVVALLEPKGEAPCERLAPVLLPRIDSAFAITIHQSQGSEFNHVAVFMPMSADSSLVTRELLYTGLTRTKQTVWVFAPEDVLVRAVETRTDRTSGLQRRLASIP